MKFIIIILLNIHMFSYSIPDFDGDNAFEFIKKQCEFGPRYPGSESHNKFADYLFEYFNSTADSVSFYQDSINHPFTKKRLEIKNILAMHNPSSKERYLFLAHWDTRDRADKDKDQSNHLTPILGANDGGSGVALLMQLSKHIKNDLNLNKIGIDILLVDAEDMGRSGHPEEWGLGTQSFVKQYKGILPKYAICVDMIADKNPIFKIEKFSYNFAKDLVYEIWELANDLGYKEFVWQLTHPIYDDHVYYHQGTGVPSIDIIDFDFPEWHTVDDTIENCSPKGLFIVGNVLINFIIKKDQP